jgi:hypothetical protein
MWLSNMQLFVPELARVGATRAAATLRGCVTAAAALANAQRLVRLLQVILLLFIVLVPLASHVLTCAPHVLTCAPHGYDQPQDARRSPASFKSR